MTRTRRRPAGVRSPRRGGPPSHRPRPAEDRRPPVVTPAGSWPWSHLSPCTDPPAPHDTNGGGGASGTHPPWGQPARRHSVDSGLPVTHSVDSVLPVMSRGEMSKGMSEAWPSAAQRPEGVGQGGTGAQGDDDRVDDAHGRYLPPGNQSQTAPASARVLGAHPLHFRTESREVWSAHKSVEKGPPTWLLQAWPSPWVRSSVWPSAGCSCPAGTGR